MRIYDILTAMLKGSPGQSPEPFPLISEIVAALGPRSFGIVLVLFGLPNLLPVPGLPMVCGVIIGVIALQMLLGKESLVLPRWVGDRRLKREDLSKVVAKAEPGLRTLEKVMRPRWLTLTEPVAQRAIGGMLLILGIALLAPIPFFGGIPPGIAVILFGLALVERDGLFVLIGIIASIIALIFTVALTWAIARSVVLMFG